MRNDGQVRPDRLTHLNAVSDSRAGLDQVECTRTRTTWQRTASLGSVFPASDTSWLKTCPCRAMGMAPGEAELRGIAGPSRSLGPREAKPRGVSCQLARVQLHGRHPGKLAARPTICRTHSVTGPPYGGRGETCGILDLEREGKMPGKPFRADQIIPKLRKAEVDLAKGSTVAQVARCFPLVNSDSQDSRREQFSYRRLRHAKCNHDRRMGRRTREGARLRLFKVGGDASNCHLASKCPVPRSCHLIGLFAESDGFELAATRSDCLKLLCHRISHLGSSQL